jgi:hypothetical protein
VWLATEVSFTTEKRKIHTSLWLHCSAALQVGEFFCKYDLQDLWPPSISLSVKQLVLSYQALEAFNAVPFSRKLVVNVHLTVTTFASADSSISGHGKDCFLKEVCKLSWGLLRSAHQVQEIHGVTHVHFAMPVHTHLEALQPCKACS